jgi:hypothetical protein
VGTTARTASAAQLSSASPRPTKIAMSPAGISGIHHPLFPHSRVSGVLSVGFGVCGVSAGGEGAHGRAHVRWDVAECGKCDRALHSPAFRRAAALGRACGRAPVVRSRLASFRVFTSAETGDSGTLEPSRCAPAMDERRVRPRRLRRGRRLTDGTVVVTSHDDYDGRVNHAIRYDESMEHVLEELEGDAAEAAYGSRGRVEIDSPAEPGAD